MPSDYIKVLETIIKEKRPDIDVRQIAPFHDLLIKPFAVLAGPIQDDITAIKALQTILDPETKPEADYDAIVANVYENRTTGTKATVTARIFLDSPTTIVVRPADAFISSIGLTFFPAQEYFFPEGVVRLNVDGQLFFVDVPVVAETEGAAYRIDAHSLVSIQGALFSFARVDNPFPAAVGGADRETNAQLFVRAKDAIAVRDLLVGKGIRTILKQSFPSINRIQVVGYLSPEMQRDIFSNVHIGGQSDLYVLPSSLKAESFQVTSVNSSGRFPLYTGTAATKRPVVYFDSIRTLNASFQPTGDALRRTERTVVPIKALQTANTYTKSSMALSRALSQIHVVSREEAFDGKTYITYERRDLFGNVLLPIARLTDGSLAVDNPFVAASADRVFVFWGVPGGMNYLVINPTIGTLTLVKTESSLVAGNESIEPNIDADFDPSGNCHLTFSRVSQTLTGLARFIWYARIQPNGVIPPLIPPRQAAFDVAGANTAPTIAVTNVGAVTATIAFCAQLPTSSNIFIVQFDDAGQSTLGDNATNLTINARQNQAPAMKADTQGNLHLFWTEQLRKLRYMKLTHTLGTLFPSSIVTVRTADMSDLKLEKNIYDFLYAYWIEPANDFTDVFSVKCSPEDGTPVGPVIDVEETPYFSSEPYLRTDSIGDLHYVWSDGAKGTDKPFYIKRTPQEYHLVVVDENQRYSTGEQLEVSVHLPAPNGIQLDVKWADLLAEIQSFVLSNDERVATAGLLVRHFLPGTISMAVKFGPRGGTLTEAAALALIQGYINNLVTSDFESSGVTELLFKNGATSVTPIEVTAEIDNIDGTIKILKGTDTLALPRTSHMSPGTITAKFK